MLDNDLGRWIPCCTCRFLPFARLTAGDDDTAYDALQQSWAIVLEKLHQYKGGYPACGWVRAIVRSQARRGRIRRLREVPMAGGSEETARLLQPTGVVGNSPEEAAHVSQMKHLLTNLIDDLPPTFRDVVRLRDLEERSPKEVARLLRISTSNVGVRLHRAHRLLRRRLLDRIRPGRNRGSRTRES